MESETKRVTIRIEATAEQIDALVREWVDEATSALNVAPVHAPDKSMTVRLTYVKEA